MKLGRRGKVGVPPSSWKGKVLHLNKLIWRRKLGDSKDTVKDLRPFVEYCDLLGK